MDKALKQRLVGASVIIALAVIVLPMLLSGRPEGGSEQAQKMEIPPRPDELAFETRRFPVTDAVAEPRSGANAYTGSATASQALPALPAAKTTPDEEKVDSAGTQPGPAEGSVPEAQVGAQSVVGPESASGAAPPAAQEIPAPGTLEHDLAADVQAEPASGPATDSSTPATNAQEAEVGSRYVVQVTSLSNTENARQLVSQLQKQGFPVVLDTVESDVGRLSRVRVGPFSKETEAVEVSARIKNEFKGTSPRVLDLKPGLAAPVTNPEDPLVRWVIQLGSFNESANAQKLVDQLRSDGMTAYLETITAKSTTTYRVLVGPFLEREEAIRTQQQLSDHLKINGVVMSAD
jgi:cell division septation protein DedD